MARRSKYTPDSGVERSRRFLTGKRTVTEVASALSITTRRTLRRWVVQARIVRGLVVGPTTEELAEIKAWRKEVADPYVAREIYKILTNPPTDLVTGEQICELRTEQHLSGADP